MAKTTIGILLLLLCLLPTSVMAQSGGRSGGGSFNRSKPENSPSDRSSPNPSRNNSTTFREDNRFDSSEPVNLGGTEAIIIVVLLIILGGISAANPRILQTLLLGGTTETNQVLPRDVSNDRVTVSKIQIALYATARSVQNEIRQLSEAADFNTKEGLRHFLRESLIILQRNRDAWCYALGKSEAFNRSAAIEKFDALSTEERMKFSVETFSRVANQRMIKKDYQNNEEVPEFIIVTVLIGTEHDKPLFEPIKTREDVEKALTACLAITATYLLTVELLWTPESDRDSLTKDDMIAKYNNLIAL